MPIRIPNELPATKTLTEENIFVMTETRAMTQDIRPLHILLLNLMPTKIDTETQLSRLLGNTPIQVELTLVRMRTHESKNTPEMIMRMPFRLGRTVREEMPELPRVRLRVALDADRLPGAENRLLARTPQLLARDGHFVEDYEPVIFRTVRIVNELVPSVNAGRWHRTFEEPAENLDPNHHDPIRKRRLIRTRGIPPNSRTDVSRLSVKIFSTGSPSNRTRRSVRRESSYSA